MEGPQHDAGVVSVTWLPCTSPWWVHTVSPAKTTPRAPSARSTCVARRAFQHARATVHSSGPTSPGVLTVIQVGRTGRSHIPRLLQHGPRVGNRNQATAGAASWGFLPNGRAPCPPTTDASIDHRCDGNAHGAEPRWDEWRRPLPATVRQGRIGGAKQPQGLHGEA